MTELELVDALSHELEGLFDGITLKGKGDVQRPIRVFRQYMPLSSGFAKGEAYYTKEGLAGYSSSDYESYFPCVLVKYIEHTDKEEGRLDQSLTSIKIMFGVYDETPDCQGYRDILNMIDRARLKLLTERVLAKKFMLAMPVKTRLLESDTWPVYFGEMELYFVTGRPIMGRDFYTKEAI